VSDARPNTLRGVAESTISLWRKKFWESEGRRNVIDRRKKREGMMVDQPLPTSMMKPYLRWKHSN
jgi:hypothetical protein